VSIIQPVAWVLCCVIVAVLVTYLRKPHKPVPPTAVRASTSDDAAVDELFEASPIGFLEIDAKGIVRRVNRKECEFRGLAPREMMGKHCTDLLPLADRQRYREQLERRMSGQVALVPYQRKYLRPDDSMVTMEVHEHLIRNRASRVVGMRLAAIDMTERKRSEDEAYQTATELRVLFQALPDLFLRLDRDGNVLDCKGGQSADPFLSPEKFSTHKLRDIVPGAVMAQLREAQDKVRKTNAVEVVEFALEGRQGKQVYEARILPLSWDEWIAVLRNITARKTAEKKLTDYAQELERKNEELESALVTAREATQLKSRFLANMSHEIRTPMNGVLGMTDFLLASKLNTEQQEYAESIKRSADALLRLINDILDLSRMEAGNLRVERVPFYLGATVEQTASLFALEARAKGLEFVSAISPDLACVVCGDLGRIGQVLSNLLGNAIKFTDQGRIGLKADIVSETPAGLKVCFTVHDTGIGIPPDQQNRLFESFIQGDSSSTRKYGGTGLGLAISKQLVELLGGEIGVASEPGHGSRFWFSVEFDKPAPGELPAQPAPKPIELRHPLPAVKREAPASPAAAVKPAVTNGTTKRVLLAEDNEINQRITLRLLQKLGVAANSVVNGKEAVETLEKEQYDLVLMDCQMPIMDGFEATAIIRSREGAGRRTPICALTANAMEGDRERCLASGMDDYISKPVGLEKLRSAVDRWVLKTENAPPEQPVVMGARTY